MPRVLALGVVGLCAGLAATRPAAAVVEYTAAGAMQALYTENVYFTPDEDGTAAAPKSSTGGSVSAELGLTSTTPRTEFSVSYRPDYRYYAEATGASNLSHALVLAWKPQLTQNTTLNLQEAGSYTPESGNFQGKSADQAFTAARRARQTRSLTTVAVASKLSARWTFNSDYSYRLLHNGRTDVPEEFAGGSGSSILFDEEAHTAGVGAGYQLSVFSTVSGHAGYTINRFEEDLFDPAVQKTRSLSASVSYAWARPDRWSVTIGVGGFRTRQDLASEAVGSSGNNTNDISVDLGMGRTYGKGSLAFGLARGLGTFEGLGRAVNVDADHDGTLDDRDGDGTVDIVIVPLGSATRTTVSAGYRYQFGERTNVALAANGSRKDLIGGGGYIDTIGVASSYEMRFARWGGLRVSYGYTRQKTAGEESDTLSDGRGFSNNTAQLGLFFSRP